MALCHSPTLGRGSSAMCNDLPQVPGPCYQLGDVLLAINIEEVFAIILIFHQKFTVHDRYFGSFQSPTIHCPVGEGVPD